MSSSYSVLLDHLLDGNAMNESEAYDLMHALATGEIDAALAGALLTALRAKGETADEIRGFATAMRELALRPAIPEGPPTVDSVGTGGDNSGSLNLSTGAGLLATPAERRKLLADASRGFLSAVTITGITGSDSGLPSNLADYLDELSALSPLPVCAGFGIRTAEDVVNVGRHAAGAIVGSALVEVLERGEDAAAYLRQLR